MAPPGIMCIHFRTLHRVSKFQLRLCVGVENPARVRNSWPKSIFTSIENRLDRTIVWTHRKKKGCISAYDETNNLQIHIVTCVDFGEN